MCSNETLIIIKNDDWVVCLRHAPEKHPSKLDSSKMLFSNHLIDITNLIIPLLSLQDLVQHYSEL